MMKPVYAIVRVDLFQENVLQNIANCIKVVKVYINSSLPVVEKEVERLNTLASEVGCIYFYNISKVVDNEH